MLRKELYKDLDKFKKTARAQRKRYYDKTKNAGNRWQPWTVAEIDAIMAHEKSDAELSKELGRGIRAIQVKRSKIKKEAE